MVVPIPPPYIARDRYHRHHTAQGCAPKRRHQYPGCYLAGGKDTVRELVIFYQYVGKHRVIRVLSTMIIITT